MEEEAKHEKAPELVDEVPTDSNPSESPSEVKVDENQNSGQPEQHENMQDNQDHHSSQNEEEKKIEEPEVAASFEAVSHEEAHQEEIKEEHPKNNDDAEEINKDSVHDDDKHDQDRVPIDSQSNEVHDEANQAEIDGSKEEDNKDPEPFEQTEVITDYSMDTLYNKKRVPYIEKNNGTLVLTQNSDYKRAIEHYNKALFAIKILLEDQNLNVGEKFAVKVIEEVEIPVSSNLTLCYLKEKDYQNVIKYADRLLEMDDNNVKILYRRGLAYTYLMEFEKAKEDFLKANKIEPSNKQILEGIKIYKEKKHEYKNNSQKFSQKIFEEKTSLYEEQVKETHNVVEEAKQPVARRSIPLLFWKITESILNIASPLINIPDKLPCVGGVCKRTKSGAARIVRDKYFKVFSITEEETKQNYEEEKEHLKKD